MSSQNCFTTLLQFFTPSWLYYSSLNRILFLYLWVLHFKYSLVKKAVIPTNGVPLLVDFSLPDSKNFFNAFVLNVLYMLNNVK